MKVNNSVGPNIANLDKTKSTKGEKGLPDSLANRASKEADDNAQVQLSNEAQQMKKAYDVAKSAAVDNEAKIAELQKLIDEGNYLVDASKIADKLVDEHLLIPSDGAGA